MGDHWPPFNETDRSNGTGRACWWDFAGTPANDMQVVEGSGDRRSLRLKRSQPHGPRDSEWQQRYERLARSLRKRQERCLSRRIITEGRVMGGGTGPEGKLPATAGEGGWQDDPPDRGDQRERGGGA
jgi:hypothetical protein